MKKQFPIKYTSKDFDNIKADLVNYAKRYYSENFRDFGDTSFVSLMLDSTAYVGDILSFYADYQTNETFLNTALEQKNINEIARQLGYRNKSTSTSSGSVAVYLLLPSNATGTAPDFDYAPVIKKGTIFSAAGGAKFILVDDVNVNQTNANYVVANVDNNTGNPTFWAVKVYGRVISGIFGEQLVNVGNFTPFLRVTLNNNTIAEIISVTDSEGNEYFEVDYLTQNVVYRSFLNTNSDSSETPNTLIPYVAARRFVVEYLPNAIFLRFGNGQYVPEDDLRPDLLAEPSKGFLEMYASDFSTKTFLDANQLVKNDKLGIAPENTTLTIRYRYNDVLNTNVAAEQLGNIDTLLLEFKNQPLLNANLLASVRQSFQITNEEAIVGSTSQESVEELKNRILSNFNSQGRIVTIQDYEGACYNLPPKYGSVKRVKAFKDLDSLRNNVNLYVLSEDSAGNFVKTNNTTKENLKVWLNKNRVLTDSVDLMDAKIINLGINYSIMIDPNYIAADVLSRANAQLIDFYSFKPHIGQSFYITDIYRELRKISGVLDVKDVEVVLKTGQNYSGIYFDVDANASNDGRYIIIPKNAAFEIKFLTTDIIGNVV